MRKREIFETRLQVHIEELRELYMYLYEDDEMFQSLCKTLEYFYNQRSEPLRESDGKKTEDKNWYRKNDIIGMTLYVDRFAKDLKGMQEKLSYLEKVNINYIHLMPLFESKQGETDGKFAVKDFRKIDEKYGETKDFINFIEKCHEKGIRVSVDFVMNHTSSEHEWAKKAREGSEEYQNRYFFFDNYALPALYERAMPQHFPVTAPGNFTWIKEVSSYVMTTFYPYEWDLNYKNPVVFNEMVGHFLYLANLGIDMIKLDSISYMWKEVNTSCKNLSEVHILLRMMRIIAEIVCPLVVLLGEADAKQEELLSYFGTTKKPECHLLCNKTMMDTIWNTVATKDVRLLKSHFDFLSKLPEEFVFLNYLRSSEEIKWELDYAVLRSFGMEEAPHKHYLNEFFSGKVEGSFSRAQLYRESLNSNDVRVCAATASLCGIERAMEEKDKEKLALAISLDTMLHACLFMQRGIPVLYSTDELAQINDYSYKKEKEKKKDARWAARQNMDWQAAKRIEDEKTVEGKVYRNLKKLEEIRKREAVYAQNAKCTTISTWDDSLFCVARENEKDKIIALFNFSEEKKIAWIDEQDDLYRDIYTDEVVRASALTLKPYEFLLLKRMNLARSKPKTEIPQKPKGLKAGPPKGVKPKMWKPPVYIPEKEEEKKADEKAKSKTKKSLQTKKRNEK